MAADVGEIHVENDNDDEGSDVDVADDDEGAADDEDSDDIEERLLGFENEGACNEADNLEEQTMLVLGDAKTVKMQMARIFLIVMKTMPASQMWVQGLDSEIRIQTQ